jgi:hypothetical protein
MKAPQVDDLQRLLGFSTQLVDNFVRNHPENAANARPAWPWKALPAFAAVSARQ